MPEFTLSDPFSAEKNLSEIPRQGSNVSSWRDELASYYAEMRKFEAMDPTEIFLRLSAFSARVGEIRTDLGRSGHGSAFRNTEIEPFLAECDRQFRLHSRIQAVRDMEFKLSGGVM